MRDLRQLLTRAGIITPELSSLATNSRLAIFTGSYGRRQGAGAQRGGVEGEIETGRAANFIGAENFVALENRASSRPVIQEPQIERWLDDRRCVVNGSQVIKTYVI